MYCPKCAESNVEGAKFCRACGEDLSVIAQVMARRFPASVLGKMDAYLARKNERLRRDSIVSLIGGTGFLFISLYHLLIQREGLSFNTAFTSLMAFFMYVWGAWDYLVYRRSLSHQDAAELPAAADTKELPAPRAQGVLGLTRPPQSVTDQTTRHLDDAERPPRRRS
jgi:zinc-ribbon domain